MRKSTKIVAGTAMSLLTLLGAEKAAEAADVLVKATKVFTEDPITRTELCVLGLPYESDIYVTTEDSENSHFRKARAQSFPIGNDNIRVGLATQAVGSDDPEVGLALRLKGKPTDNSFVKADIRYMPETDVVDTYAFITANLKNAAIKKVTADILAAHNRETDSTFARPGVDATIYSWKGLDFTIGYEAKFAGTGSDVEEVYSGPRIGISGNW
ncbi:MAG: hypothetical protein ABIE22_02500 [archaeon]